MSISDEKISKSSALDIADAGEIAEKPIDIPEPQEITRFNKMREYRIKNSVDTQNRINTLLQKLETEKTDRLIQLYIQQLADAKRILRIQESYVEFMRIPESDEDSKYRLRIIKEFSDQVRDSVPSELPLVFHGTNNIGTVREIIKSNGLLTPEQKGESTTSFAVQIDVTSRSNVRVSCEFAEPGVEKFMPYGAIFAFLPKPEEVEKVNDTGESSEVFNGVDGVNFNQEPDRLCAIITTPENITRVQEWCEEYGLDGNKVLTHDGFLELF